MEAVARFKVGDRVKVTAPRFDFMHLLGMVVEVASDGRHCVYNFKSFCGNKTCWFPGEELELLPNDSTNNPEILDSSPSIIHFAFLDELQGLLNEQSEWSQRTFGSDSERGPIGPLKHLKKEVEEAIEAHGSTEYNVELADCFLLLLDATRRSGLSFGDLVRLSLEKMEVNKSRVWPCSTKTDEPTEHVRDGEAASNTSEISNSCESAPVEAEVLTQAKTLQRVLYLAGPMRGIAFYNFPMFDRVAAALRDVGYEVINPADEDRKEDNFDPTLEPKFANPAYCVVQPGMDFGKIIRRCFEAVMRCDEIVLLPGWENSVGAIAELFIAVWSGKRIQLVYPEENDQMQFISTPAIDLATAISRIQIARDETKQSKEADDEDILDIAARITRGDRQAVYGPPEQDFKKTADMWTGLFQYMLNGEAKFEPRHVAMALICMKMSREFHQRKKDNWVDIAGYARCGSLCE